MNTQKGAEQNRSTCKITKQSSANIVKAIVQPKKGGFRRVIFKPFRLPTPSLMFFWTLKGLIFWFKFQIIFSAFSEKKHGVLFYVMVTTKNLKAHCDCATFHVLHPLRNKQTSKLGGQHKMYKRATVLDIAWEPLWWYVKGRHRVV